MLSIEQLVSGLGKLLKTIRLRDGLTQKDFAQKINISISMLQKFEAQNAVNDFSVSVLASLASYLETDIGKVIDEIKILECDDSSTLEKKLNLALTKEELSLYQEAANQNSEILGNLSTWALKTGSLLLQLPSQRSKVNAELEILKGLTSASPLLLEKYQNRMKKLFAATLEIID